MFTNIRKIKKILLIIFILISVGLILKFTPNYYAFLPVGKLNDYKFDDSEIPKLDSVEKYSEYLSKTLKYKEGVAFYWQLPEETWKLKTGVCKDYSTLFMYLVETRLGKRTSLVAVKNIHNKDSHVLVKIDNIYYDLINNYKTRIILSDWEFAWEAVYEEVMWMVFNYHTSVGKYYYIKPLLFHRIFLTN